MTVPKPPKATPSAPAKIADVARLASVSVATVSRALANPDVVNAETRKRVLDAVREMGYTPNVAARNLRVRKSRMVLVVVPDIGNAFFSEVLRGIDETLSSAGYGLIIANLGNSAEKESRYVDLAYAGQVDGVLLLCGHVIASKNRSIRDARIPIVAVCERISGETFPQVEIDNRNAARKAVEHLIERGHRQIAYLSGPKHNILETERYSGLADALAEAKLPLRKDWLLAGDFTFDAGLSAASTVLAMPPNDRPSALFAANDEMAIGFMKAVQDAGLAIPDDIAIIGFDGVAFADFCTPPLTTIVQPRVMLGEKGAQLLLEQMTQEHPNTTKSIQLIGELTIKKST